MVHRWVTEAKKPWNKRKRESRKILLGVRHETEGLLALGDCPASRPCFVTGSGTPSIAVQTATQ